MSKTLTIITFIVSVMLLSFAMYYFASTQPAQGSVIVGNEYRLQQITSADVGTTTVRERWGSIGTIIVASTSAGTGANVLLYDTAVGSLAEGTTTSATTTLLYTLDGDAPVGDYTFDVIFDRGLMIDVMPGFLGDISITYR